MKTAVLIQAHKNEEYIKALALQNKSIRFYVHMDAKCPEKQLWLASQSISNVFLVKKPRSVYWGGSSQIFATLDLMKMAYADERNEYFHLISAECLPLKSFSDMEREWDNNPSFQYIESHRDKSNEWRLKVRVPHSDTLYLRTFLGRCLNKFFKVSSLFIDTVNFGRDNFYFGSQWFSVTRKFISEVLNSHNSNFFDNFKNITCADEHAFSIFARTLYSEPFYIQDNNLRYIRFSGKSSPEYLSEQEILSLKVDGDYWFSRKVNDFLLLKEI